MSAGANPVPSYLGIPTRLRDFNSVFDAFEWELLCQLRVALTGVIVSFDAVKQTAQIQPTIKENILKDLVSTPTQLPLLIDVPVIFFRAGNCALTLPVQPGDECLVIFTDMDYNAWFSSGGIQSQEDRRRHDLSDGFAIVGIWNQTRKLPSYSSNTAQLRSDDGQTVIELDPTAGTVHIQAKIVNVNSSQQVNITGGGHTTIEGKDFLTHQHIGVQTGGGTSGPVL